MSTCAPSPNQKVFTIKAPASVLSAPAGHCHGMANTFWLATSRDTATEGRDSPGLRQLGVPDAGVPLRSTASVE